MKYIPYPQLSIDWSFEKPSFTVNLPWIILEIDVKPKDRYWIHEATCCMEEPFRGTVQKFFKMLSDYPVAYIAPKSLTKKLQKQISTLLPEDLTAIPLETPSSYIEWVLGELLLKDEVKEKFSSLSFNFYSQLKYQWEWNVEEVCQEAQIKDTDFYDPITVITFLRGLMLDSDAKTDELRTKIPENSDCLREKDENLFFEFMKEMLRNTHYITQKFQEYAPLSLIKFSKAKGEITQFLKEEKGHDKLMEHSLNVLGCKDLKEIPVSLETIVIMEMFKQVSKISPLSFTAMIGFFEGGEYGKSDPIADVLKKSSLPESALGYQRHFEINKQENHNNMAYKLAEKLPVQSKNSVILAVRTLEIACYFATISDRKLFEKTLFV